MAAAAAAAARTFFFLFYLVTTAATQSTTSPYHSPSNFRHDYHLMLRSLKIYAYSPLHNDTFPSTSPCSLFHRALLRSRFLTSDPSAAHLFYLTSPFDHRRHLARSVRTLRSAYPFWNRALGSDHFFLTENPLDPGSDRNLIELAKNSIRISPFPFFPHKDLTLPLPISQISHRIPSDPSSRHFFFYGGNVTPPIAQIIRDLEAFVDDGGEGMKGSRFCLFFHGIGDGVGMIGRALRLGCVPVVIAERGPVELPFGDVLRWREMVVVVGMGGGAEAVRRAVGIVERERYQTMREMGMAASGHFRWSEEEEGAEKEEYDKVDVFRTILYQLWRRRHVIRYTGWEDTAT